MGKRFKEWRKLNKAGRQAKHLTKRGGKAIKAMEARESISTGGSIRTKKQAGGLTKLNPIAALRGMSELQAKPKPKKERGYGQAQEGRGGYSKGGSVASRLSKAGPVAKPN